MKIGERIDAWRRIRGWSQRQTAQAMGLSIPSVSNIVSGRQGVSAVHIERLAHALGLTMVEFYGGLAKPAARKRVG